MRNVLLSCLSAKGQVTIPKKVRDVLGARTGDMITYEVEGNAVRLRRVEPFDAAFHAALSDTLAAEWGSEQDDEAFRGL